MPRRQLILDHRRVTESRAGALAGGLAGGLLLLALLHGLGLRRRAELAAWDALAYVTAPADAGPVVLVELTDRDAAGLGPVLDDGALATVLDSLLALQPAAIGVALLRDRPVGPDSLHFRATVTGSDRVVLAAAGPSEGWPWPFADDPAAAVRAGRVADGRLLEDAPEGVVRRLDLDPPDRVGDAPFLPLATALAARTPGYQGPTRLIEARLPTRAVAYGASDGAAGSAMVRFPWAAPRRVALADVMRGRRALTAGLVRGRIVVLGSATTTNAGVLATAVSRYTDAPARSAAEVQATLAGFLGHLAMGDLEPVQPARLRYGTILVGAALLTAGWLGVAAPVLGLGAGLAALGAALAALGAWAITGGIWLPVASAAIAGLGAGTAGRLAVSVQERRKRELLGLLFRQYVAPSVAAEAWAARDTLLAGGRPKPVEAPVTVLVADLRGFTAATEARPAAATMALVSDWTGRLADLVQRHGGLVDDYAGDGFKADFGVPVVRREPGAIAEDAARAVQCAVAMARALERLNRERADRGEPSLAMRIGIASGRAAAGTIGGGSRLKYTVVGDVVNVAARLEQLELPAEVGPCRIIGAETTRALAPQSARYRDLGEQSLRGRQEPVRAHLVEWEGTGA